MSAPTCICGHEAASHYRAEGHCRVHAPRGVTVDGVCGCPRFIAASTVPSGRYRRCATPRCGIKHERRFLASSGERYFRHCDECRAAQYAERAAQRGEAA